MTSMEPLSSVSNFFVENEKVIHLTAEEKRKNITKLYGTDFKDWTWAPNLSDTQPINPPSGFSMTVNASSPVIPAPFHPVKLFYGTSAFCLDGVKFKDGSPITEESLIKNRTQLKSLFNTFILENSGKEIGLDDFDEKTNRDKKEWKEQLGGDGAYAGIYSSVTRGTHKYETQFWLVVQSGYKPISENLYRSMEKGGHKTTWEKFFIKNTKTYYGWDCVRRNRQRLLYQLAEACELDVSKQAKPDVQSVESQKTPQILEPTIETITHSVSVKNGLATYHNNTVAPEVASMQGLIFNENPLLGPVILKGPPQTGKPFGLSWTGSNTGNRTFPCCTGRQKPLQADSDLSSQDSLISQEDLTPFVWENINKSNNLRLAKGIYRPRDVGFKSVESLLGYSHLWGEIQLKPVVVKMACCP